ncbi:MAG TPA: TauD/TfdA family dioxygenase [Pyrinomonadaceae bacterium]|jgi:alpha-ketoglutarate-dependent taurine dioxygenase|nr:TauD/TfdA family dioxygenase [Pyrinomonadaceae bacterium]
MPLEFSGLKTSRRKAVSVSQEKLVSRSFLPAHEGFPLVMQPEVENLNLAVWAANNRQQIEEELLACGAILFRGFKVETVEKFEEVARAVSPQLLDYLERAAPRSQVGRNVYTSTAFPADQHIPLHHEMSYSHNWPTKIWFYCLKAAEQRGATPIADDRKIFRRLDPEIKEVFMRKKVMYVRNYGEGVDLSWPDAFQTTDRAKVEEYCRLAHTEFEWKGGDRLRTRQVRQAVAVHPVLGETVWFNHAHMFHVSNLEPAVRDALLSEFKQEDLPRNAFYGDGTPIETSALDHIREVYRETAVTIPWQEGDIMLLDNFLTSHGREPFVGPRQIVVAMAELYTNQEIQAITS